MNILDKQPPSTGGNTNSSSIPTPGSMTPSSADCLIPNSQLIPSLAVPPSSTAPSSVSSSSAPHTPIDTLNPVNCQSDLTSNGLPNRPNVSTPSSVFNSSAPNTPLPCPSVGSDANITSPALNQLDYGEQKLFNSGPPPPQPLPNNGNTNNMAMLHSPLNVPQSMCNDTKNKTISNGNSNKKHCNNRNQNNFGNMSVNNDRNIACDNNVSKSQINFSTSVSNMSNMPLSSMPNGPQLNGSISPFDSEGKMCGFPGDFSPHMPDGMTPPMPNMPATRPPNCPINMPNMMNCGSSKMCNNMPSNPLKGSIDPQYMQQHQSQIFVFNTVMANQAAEAVESGQFHSMIDFHLANPLTKQFLEKHSLKIHNFNKPNSWMGGIRQPRLRGPNPNGMGLRGNHPCFSPYNHNPPGPGPGGGPQWNSWSNPPQGYFPNDVKMNCGVRQYGPQYNNNFNNNLQSFPMGNDIQDDNLTPQQKQHREKQLAILANLQQKFCPELMESNNRLPPQSSHPNDFSNLDPLSSNNSNQQIFSDSLQIKSENDQLNQGIPSDSSLNFNTNFGPNSLMNNQPGNDQWLKNSPFTEEKQFNGRRKGPQPVNNNSSNLAHQPPMSQQSVNSPNSCPISQSPGNRVPPPPYNQGLRTMTSPHPASPATASLSMSSPRMQTSTDNRSQTYTPGSVRSGPSTPADSNCALINNSPKSSQNNSTNRSNSSPGNKKSKTIDSDLGILNTFSSKSEPALMPVPSPKQIDYINSFEGQELTIQKQPNAHFQDDLLPSNEMSMNSLFPNDFMCPSVNNPLADMNPNSKFPITSQSCSFESNMRFNGGSMDNFRPPNVCNPQFNLNDSNIRFPNCDNSIKPRMTSPVDINTFPSNPINDMNFNNSIQPINNDNSAYNGPNPPFNELSDNPMSSTHLQSLQKMAPPFDISNKDVANANSKPMHHGMMNSNHMGANPMHPNIPQNANPRMPGFDPSFQNMPCNDLDGINFPNANMHQSNLQMNYPNNFSNGPRMPSNMPNESQYPMHSNNSFPMQINSSPHPMMDQNNVNVPNTMTMIPPSQANFRFSGNMNRSMTSNTHGPRYNSPNIQVKPDAPNTIQYLPSRPQGPANTPPNRTPNLDFLQQSLNMGNKSSNSPSFYPNNQGMPSNNRPMMNPNINFPRGQMTRPQNPHISGPMCPTGNEIFNRPPGANMMNGPNNMAMNSGSPNNFPHPGPNKTNAGPVIHPDSTPTSFNFKQTSYNLPNTSDPNYAAQFHNFQQQLYATNTRNSNVTSNPRMSSNF